MSEKKLAQVFYADLWGLRKKKYDYLFKNDIQTTKWQKLKPIEPYYFFVPKDFALQKEYGKFWKITDIFKEWSSGVKTSRDKFVVGYKKNEIMQKIIVFIGPLSDEFVKESLKLTNTRDWSLSDARKKAKAEKIENKIISYAYRAFDNRFICYSFSLIEPGNDRFQLMKNLLCDDLAVCSTRIISGKYFDHAFISDCVGDYCYISNKTKEVNYFFPLYLYEDKSKGHIFDGKISKQECISNFNSNFLQAVKEAVSAETSPEEIFYYIYAVLYSPTHRRRYQEFLKIDFPRIPLSKNYKSFNALSNFGHELVDLHLLKHPAVSETEIGFPESGSNIVEKVRYDEKTRRIYINKAQYFEGASNEVWEYRIGAYQVMHKYLKDRKGRKLSLDEINHYMKIAKAMRLTIEIQDRIDKVYKKIF